MDLEKIKSQLSVSPQMLAADVTTLAKLGVRSIICNRRDDESADQSLFAEIEKAANNVLSDRGKLQGIAYYDGHGLCPSNVKHGKIGGREWLAEPEIVN